MKLEDDDGVVLVYELRDCETGRPTIKIGPNPHMYVQTIRIEMEKTDHVER